MEIFRAFLGPDELLSEPNWHTGKGWGKDAPTLVFRNGNVVQWRTMDQGARRLAGASVDHILIDEPPGAALFRELERRVSRRGGDLSLALTPVNAPDDLTWLRDQVREGHIEDMVYPMTPTLYQLETGHQRRLLDGTVCDQSWIDKQIESILPQWRDIIINGGWEELAINAVFGAVFSRSRHLIPHLPDGHYRLALGIDHGTKDFTETAVLVAVDESKESPIAYILGVYEADANAAANADAAGILALLDRHKLSWGDLDYATGDIPHLGGRGTIGRKTNYELQREIRRAAGRPIAAPFPPEIRTAKTGRGSNPRGSVYLGQTWLFKALKADRLKVLAQGNESMLSSFERYRGGSTDPAGHLMDALRYALDPWIRFGSRRLPDSPKGTT
jgi:hypothetical protein